MPQEPTPPNDSLIPSQPIPAGAQELSKRVGGLLDGQPKDDRTVAQALEGMDDIVELMAAGMYNMASMLVGEGEDSALLVEAAISTAKISPCADPLEARKSSRRTLCAAALDTLETCNPGSLAAPEGLEPAATCIEEDDLDAAGVSSEELEGMIAGPDRERVRTWLASLPAAMRTIFVLRAVAGFTTAETIALLKAHGGPQAAGWSPDAVRELFRQGLCSLASQLLQAANR
ncbi:MAG: hypothetical protein ABSC88_05025 [Terracidiphilus sp.]|jgi:hypothetical protein